RHRRHPVRHYSRFHHSEHALCALECRVRRVVVGAYCLHPKRGRELMYRARRRAAEISRHAILIVILGLSFFGVYWMVETSFTYDALLTVNYWWPDLAHVNLANYTDAFQAVYRYILNSVFVSATILIGVLALGTTTAYVFARFSFPGKEVLFYFII